MDGTEMVKKLVTVLVAVVGLIAGGYYGFLWLLRDAVETPLLEFLSIFGAVCLLAGLGSLATARRRTRERRLLTESVTAPLEKSGKRAVAGVIEPVGEALEAPFSHRECVAYDYRISTGRKSGKRNTYQLHFTGMHLTPSRIRSAQGDCNLFAFPNLEHFHHHDGERTKAQDYVDRVSFDNIGGGLSQFGLVGAAADVFTDDDGAVAKDWRLEPLSNLNKADLKERMVPPGLSVCAVGVYDAARGGLVPDASEGGVTLYEGSPEDVFADMGAGVIGYIVLGILLLLAAAATLAPIAMDLP